MKTNKALILVDIQNDFCHGGSLEVPNGDAVVAVANHLQSQFNLVIATKDWHPSNHMSFAANHPEHKVGDIVVVHGFSQILWPAHCIQDSHGAEFHSDLNQDSIHKTFYKGTNPAIDSYSAFFDNEHQRSTGLADYLREQGVTHLYIMGLATDYCVKYSCRDAVQLGFDVHVIEDGCRGVELKPGDVANAYQEMRDEGVKVIHSANIY